MLTVASSPELAWTPQVSTILIDNIMFSFCLETYESCFNGDNQTDSMSSGISDTPYQVLSRRGLSAVQWERHNGMYVFAATVVAENYRYIVFVYVVYKLVYYERL